MDEVHVIARGVARKGNEGQVKALLQGMLAPTQAEPGCKLYELYESDESGRFYFYESWENPAALMQHVASVHYQHLQRNLGDLLEEFFEVNILTRVPNVEGSPPSR